MEPKRLKLDTADGLTVKYIGSHLKITRTKIRRIDAVAGMTSIELCATDEAEGMPAQDTTWDEIVNTFHANPNIKTVVLGDEAIPPDVLARALRALLNKISLVVNDDVASNFPELVASALDTGRVSHVGFTDFGTGAFRRMVSAKCESWSSVESLTLCGYVATPPNEASPVEKIVDFVRELPAVTTMAYVIHDYDITDDPNDPIRCAMRRLAETMPVTTRSLSLDVVDASAFMSAIPQAIRNSLTHLSTDVVVENMTGVLPIALEMPNLTHLDMEPIRMGDDDPEVGVNVFKWQMTALSTALKAVERLRKLESVTLGLHFGDGWINHNPMARGYNRSQRRCKKAYRMIRTVVFEHPTLTAASFPVTCYRLNHQLNRCLPSVVRAREAIRTVAASHARVFPNSDIIRQSETSAMLASFIELRPRFKLAAPLEEEEDVVEEADGGEVEGA